MYIAITAQKLGQSYSNSAADYVAYLEKENEGLEQENQEHFFNQTEDRITPDKVISEIDANTAKLKKTEPKFYSIVVSPSQRELKKIADNPEALKTYTRELMKDYAKSFYREKPVTVDQIKYFAKIEHERTYRGFEKEVLENAPYRKRIAKLENDIRKVARGELKGTIKKLEQEIAALKEAAPHQINGQMIVAGMKKEGNQSHIHIIVSRKDVTNTFSLSPGSNYKASEVEMHGKKVQRGFHRDQFFEKAEQTFDRVFGYDRNFVETYTAKKTLVKNPAMFRMLLGNLPTNEKALALKLLSKSGMRIPSIPTNKVQLALKVFHRLRRGMQRAIESGSIGI
ncbi:mobilization protein [Maribacter algarum]|uniref:Mobilization protein n=1 Tax=Maribacter algarum (ex Zhang et al. 2020) TaxID=2578118 RepID=A0A5S3PMX8_9FLAO|nr:MobB family relaxase [Maribacter algarum]TMM55822.1 mobilization protein [Maribacter algarum]